MKGQRALSILLGLAVAVAVAGVSGQSDARQAGAGGRPVSEHKAAWTPTFEVNPPTGWKDSKQVWDSTQGQSGIVFSCGQFGAVDGSARTSVAAWHSTGPNRGALTGFAPTVTWTGGMATVYRCMLSPDGLYLYLAGRFDHVNGEPHRNLAAIRLSDEQVVSDFKPAVDGQVFDLDIVRGRLLLVGYFNHVGGQAQKGIATVNKRTGAYSPYFHSRLRGAIPGTNSATHAYRVAVNPNGREMVAIVDTTRIDGAKHTQLAKWNLTSRGARLQSWRAPITTDPRSHCLHKLAPEDVTYTPGGGRFVVVNHGGPGKYGMCDRTLLFRSGDRGAKVRPVWENRTCADTLTAVAVSRGIIYVQGHHKCVQARPGFKANYVPRNGIAALHMNGTVVRSWRSDQPKCIGGRGLTVTSKGDLISSIDCVPGVILRVLPPH